CFLYKQAPGLLSLVNLLLSPVIRPRRKSRHVARIADRSLEDPGRGEGSDTRKFHGDGAIDQSAYGAVEAPLRAKLTLAEAAKLRVGTAQTPAEGSERNLTRQFSAADGEPQTVAGHRIDEARRIAGEQQPGHAGVRRVNGERTEDDGRRDERRGSKAFAEARVSRNLPEQH